MHRTKYNIGYINKKIYYKNVSLNKAVLWKDRQISLNPSIISQLVGKKVTHIVFMDNSKEEKWTISMARFLKYSTRL